MAHMRFDPLAGKTEIEPGTTMRCPGCGDMMDARRSAPEVEWMTNGVCSPCVTEPRNRTVRIERERREAAFGKDRC